VIPAVPSIATPGEDPPPLPDNLTETDRRAVEQFFSRVMRTFKSADEKAIGNRKLYRVFGAVAAVTGTLAVLLAIAQLTEQLPKRTEPLEWVMAGLALTAVVSGLVMKAGRICFSRASSSSASMCS
jgi:RsiW-degrading membrane proteinase PrsW (M82 family)